MAFSAQHLKTAIAQLRRNDRVMKSLIRQVGPFTLRAQRQRFNMLARSIVSQQISVAAAKTILGRLCDSLQDRVITPEALVGYDVDQLRSVGVSRQKATYLLDLRDKVLEGVVCFEKIGRKDDEAIIDELTQVKGIGRWTAEMFLIFSLGRLDVFPYDDLSIRSALRNVYELADMPTRDQANEISERWKPYRTIGTWYLWQSLDQAKES